MSDTNVSYVRESMIAPSEPPLRETGIVKWMRENLFSSWLNSILTVLSLAVIWIALSNLVPWLWHSVWNTGSLNECREVISATYGDLEHGAACFSVLGDRWHQLLFGFYPSELYWRPILTFVLMFVALAPVLFSEHVPAKLIWFSIAFPFIAPWLLWGGSFWVPVLIALGFVVGYIGFNLIAKVSTATLGVIGGILVAILWWAFAMPAVNDGLHRMVASGRMESTLSEQKAQLEVLPEELAALNAENEVQTATINGLLNEKAVLLESITQTRNAGDEPSENLLSEFETVISDLSESRSILFELGRNSFALEQEISDANGMVAKIENLPTWEVDLKSAEALAAELKAELPDSVKGLISVAQAEPGTSAEDIAALGASLDASNALVALKRNVTDAYEQIGLVGLTPVSTRAFGGFMLSLIIGLAGIVLSLPLGILLALGRQANLPIIKGFSVAFIEGFRGVPLIVWLFTASLLLNYFLPPGTSFDLVLRVVILVTLFSAAYIAEVIRGGLAALPKGQYEAADSLGLDYWKSMRLIVLPQALKISIPGIVNTFIGLFKDTTLVGIIGLLDPLKLSDSIRASTDWNGIYWELYIFIGLMFFVSCFSMGRYSLWLEKKLQRGHR